MVKQNLIFNSKPGVHYGQIVRECQFERSILQLFYCKIECTSATLVNYREPFDSAQDIATWNTKDSRCYFSSRKDRRNYSK